MWHMFKENVYSKKGTLQKEKYDFVLNQTENNVECPLRQINDICKNITTYVSQFY